MLRQDQVKVYIWNTNLFGSMTGGRTSLGHAALEYYDYNSDIPTRVLINFLPKMNSVIFGLSKTGAKYDDTQSIEMRDPKAIENFLLMNRPSEIHDLDKVDVNRIQLYLAILSLNKQQWSMIGGSVAASVFQSIKGTFFSPTPSDEKISSTSLILALLNAGGISVNLSSDINSKVTFAAVALSLVWAAAAAEVAPAMASAALTKSVINLVIARATENVVNGSTLADNLSQEIARAISPLTNGVKALFFITPEQLKTTIMDAKVNQSLNQSENTENNTVRNVFN